MTNAAVTAAVSNLENLAVKMFSVAQQTISLDNQRVMVFLVLQNKAQTFGQNIFSKHFSKYSLSSPLLTHALLLFYLIIEFNDDIRTAD